MFLSTCVDCPSIDHVYRFKSVKEIDDMIVDNGFKIIDNLVLPVEDRPMDEIIKNSLLPLCTIPQTVVSPTGQPAVAPVLTICVVNRTKTHPVQSVFTNPIIKPLSHVWVCRIDEAMCAKASGVLLQAIQRIPIVPAMENCLHQNGMCDSIGIHIPDQFFIARRVLRCFEI